MITSDSSAPRSRISEQRVIRWVKGGNIAFVRALSASDYDVVISLDDTRLLLNKSFGICLRASPILDRNTIVKNVKQFCGELLDRCTPNHWKTTLRASHACMNTRWAVASSLFSLRKCLTSNKPEVAPYVKSMCVASPPLDKDFAIFASALVGKIFPRGWDKGYWNAVKNFTPPTKSNIDRLDKGTYRERAVCGNLSRDKFLRWAGGTVTSPISRRVRATAVQAGGKWRIITLSDPSLANLLPLHKTIYNRLTKEKWLLRGEAKPDCFGDFGRHQGEVFVSGDYESATDNLNLNLTELVLRRLLFSATHIPTRVREEAMASLRLSFENKGKKFLGVSAKGQLMGSPLSFPLLCLINYLTFRYAVRREVPVKINGDDIVFRATPEETRSWFNCVAASGLVVSLGKTLVSNSFFSLNSTYFRALGSGVRLVPHFRASTLRKKCEDMGALTGRVAQIKRDLAAGALRYSALRVLLRKNLGMIYSAQGSFGRRFDCRLPIQVLDALRIKDRESFYLQLPFEPGPIEKFCGWRQDVVPKEWKKSGSLMASGPVIADDIVRREMVLRSWSQPIVNETRDDWWRRCREDTYKYVPFRKLTFHLYRKFARTHFVPSVSYPRKEEKKWCDNTEVGGLSRSVAFELGGVLSSDRR